MTANNLNTDITCIANQEIVTMTLKEITDILNVRHNNAVAVVSKMSNVEGFGKPKKIQYSYDKGKNSKGTIYTYELNKIQSIAVAAKLNTDLLVKIVIRWEELEAKEKNAQQAPAPTTAPQSAPKQLTCKGETIPLLTDKQQYWLPFEPLCHLLQINYYAMVKSVGKLNIKLQSIKHDNKTWLCIALNDASTWLNSINLRYYQLVKRKQLMENIETLLAHIATVQTQTTAPAAAKPATVESLLYAFEQVIGEPVVVITKKQARQTIENVGNVDPKRLCAFDLRAFADNYKEQLDFVQSLLHDKGSYHLPKLPA